MLIESVIISINILLSIIYKKRIDLSVKEKKNLEYTILFLQIIMTSVNYYFIFPLVILLTYNFLYKRKKLIILNFLINNIFCILLPNYIILALLFIYNPLILWSKL